MKATACILPICLCMTLTLVFGGSSFGAEPRPEWTALGPTATSVEIGAAEPAPEPEMPNVWIEAMFVELDGDASDELEGRLGFRLSPPDGKTILNARERERLVAAIEEMRGSRIVASLSVLTISGQQTQSEDVEELTFPTEYDTETVSTATSGAPPISGEVFMVTPGNWEQRDVGAILNVTPSILRDGRIALVLMPQLTLLAGWENYGNERYPIRQPIFRTWNKTTTVIIPNGSTFVLKESPVSPLKHARVGVPPQPSGRVRQRAVGRIRDRIKAPPRIQPKAADTLQKEEQELLRLRSQLRLDSQDQLMQYQELSRWSSARNEVKARIAELKSQIETLGGLEENELVNAIQGNPAIYQLATELAKQEAKLESLLSHYGPEHPEVVGQKRRVQVIKEKVRDLAKGFLDDKKAELTHLEAYDKELDKIAGHLKEEIAEAEKLYSDYLQRKSQLERKRAIFDVFYEGGLEPRESEAIEEKPNPNRAKILGKLETMIPKASFEDAPLSEVLDFLSEQCDVDFVIDAGVFEGGRDGRTDLGGNITVNLTNVPLKDALKYILKWKNLKYVVEDHAVLITPSDYLDPESLETEIFRLAAGNARAIEKSLRRSGIPWPKGTNVIVKELTEPGTGTLIVTNTPNNMVLVRELVHAWDRPAPRQKGAPKAGTTLLTIISAKIVESK
jgi:hypothetical protein